MMVGVLIGAMFLFLYRPFEIWPALGEIHLERIYMVGAIGAVLLNPRRRWIANAQNRAYAAFAIVVLLSWLVSPWMSRGDVRVENYLKLLVFYPLLISTVAEEQALRRVVVGLVGVTGLYMAHSLREYLNGRNIYAMGISRMVGIDRMEADPNSFGTSIVYVLPLLALLWEDRPSRRLRLGLWAHLGLSVVCILLTGSRSSLLGLLFVVGVLVGRHRQRGRLTVLLGVVAPLIWFALPGSLQNRFMTILDPSVGPANAQESAEGRRQGFWLGLTLWQKYPVLGCGPNAFMAATGSPIQSHNLYGQLTGELGTLGVLAFAAILACFWSNIRAIRTAYRAHPDWPRDFLYHLAGAVGLSVLLLLLLGNFADNLFRYTWVWYGGFLVIARHCVERRAREQALRELDEDADPWTHTPWPSVGSSVPSGPDGSAAPTCAITEP
jgi:O-antigen ligase